jgi:hypothetical protein
MEAAMNELDPRAQALIDSVRGADAPTRNDRARIKRRILARVAAVTLAASAGTASTTTAASVGTAAAASLTATKLALVGLATSVLVAGAAATGVVASREHVQRAAPAQAPLLAQVDVGKAGPVGPPVAAESEPREAEVAQQTTSPAPKGDRGAASRAPAPRAASAPAAETLEQELPLLKGAQEALRAGDLDRALSLLEAHAKRFPRGGLTEERRAAHAIVSCRRTPGAAARAEAEAFVHDLPSSPLVERVAEACAPGPR